MSESPKPSFTIMGAGLAGPLMATYLGQAGHTVNLYEMRADPRKAGAAGGKSINLALSLRGTHALDEVGVLEKVHRLTIPMKGRMMHDASGALTFQPYGTEEEQVLYSVSRGMLNQTLLDAAEACPGVTLHFDQKCLNLDLDEGRAVMESTRTGQGREVETGMVIGADGAFSRVRAALQRRSRFDYRQDYLEYGYKELCLPASENGGFALEQGALHIWPRRSYMLIALPNLDGSFTCTLFWPYEGPVSFEALAKDAEIQEFFERNFPDVPPLMPNLLEEFHANPVGPLVTVRCRPWRIGGKAVLLGDACHAVVPFYGQGMNAAFEDCTVLNACIAEHAPDFEKAFAAYEAARKENADALADLAIANFVEMRDRVASGSFLLRKKTERVLHRLFPRWFLPLYTMVTFTRIPYAEARERARRQDRTVLAAAGVVAVLMLLVLLTVVARAF